MNFIKNIVIYLLHIRKIIRWYSQYFKCKRNGLFYKSLPELSWSDIGNALIIAPHSDDEWIGSYTVLTNITSPDVFYCCYYGNDYSKDNKSIRDKEIKECANKNNYNLYCATKNDRDASLAELLSHGYKSIFIPSPFDWHPEHRAVFRLVFEILQTMKSKPVVYYYQISVPHKNYQSLYISGMSRIQQNNKWVVFQSIYKSQKMPVLRYKLQEKLNAGFTDFYAAEIFVKPSHQELYDDFLNMCAGKDKLLESYRLLVDNIFVIRNLAFKQESYELRK